MLSEKTKDEKRKHDVKTGPAKAGNNREIKPNRRVAAGSGTALKASVSRSQVGGWPVGTTEKARKRCAR